MGFPEVEFLAPGNNNFLDYKKVEWDRVARAHYAIRQRISYEYPGPVKNLRQRLVVIPLERHGNQQLASYKIAVSAHETNRDLQTDVFGNKVLQLSIPEVPNRIDFEISVNLARNALEKNLPLIPLSEAKTYLAHTRLTTPGKILAEAAREMAGQYKDPLELAGQINKWVYGEMGYQSGITSVSTTAEEAYALKKGLCQDYSHIMLALCRSANLPARYISGHLLGEGGSHAWVEVLVPDSSENFLQAIPFDPTNNCQAGLKYITIAVGRDYSDVPPTSGCYTAPYSGRLVAKKQAGLIHLEFIT